MLGITPTDAQNKGESYLHKNKFAEKRKPYIAHESSWELRNDLKLESDKEYSEIFEGHMENIFEKLRPVKEKFLEVTKNCEAWIYMVVDYYDFSPYLDVRKKISKQLAEFNLDLIFKFYFVENEQLEKNK